MNIGSGWTNKNEEGKVTSIALKLDDAICELYPQLKQVRFTVKPIPKDQQKNDKSPTWRLSVYKPEEQTSSKSESSVTEDEIPF